MTKPKSSSSRPVNVGVIGLGFMGLVHIKAYRQIPAARLVAVADAFKQPVNGVIPGVGGNITDGDALKLTPGVQAYRDAADLIADPNVHLVDICVPTPEHVSLSVAALKAGKHVVCEKPLARTSAECRQVTRAAARAKGFFMPAMCMRFWPGWDWLKQAIDRKTYGPVLAARFRRVSGPPGWSKANYFKGGESGGALLDLHIHDTDFVQFCFGRPQAVFSRGLSRFSGAVDHVVTQYIVKGGAAVSAEGSWLMSGAYPFTMKYTVNFAKATADFDIARGDEALRLYPDGRPVQTIKLAKSDGYVGELAHMIQSIRRKRPPTTVTAKDGLTAVEICEAEEQSVLTGKVIRL
ncbi:MAG: Gfo/Idh/MocA family oxidoreductase [Verrucomicrobia bacterium]|nr:Gfo/Idh/MocA family oxidoreductase [Verrucomicrobiota bacterium]